MGTIFQKYQTIDLPSGAVVIKDKVTWTAKGERRTSTLAANGKVLIPSEN